MYKSNSGLGVISGRFSFLTKYLTFQNGCAFNRLLSYTKPLEASAKK